MVFEKKISKNLKSKVEAINFLEKSETDNRTKYTEK